MILLILTLLPAEWAYLYQICTVCLGIFVSLFTLCKALVINFHLKSIFCAPLPVGFENGSLTEQLWLWHFSDVHLYVQYVADAYRFVKIWQNMPFLAEPLMEAIA